MLIADDGANNEKNSPTLLRWDIVSKCNLSCTHCCVGDMLRDPTKVDLTTEEIYTGIRNAAKGGVKQVHFLGGEPTIRRDFIDIMRYTRECGLDISFNTNGIRQDEKFFRALQEISPLSITTSVDGPDAQSHDAVRGVGTFAKTISFIRRLVERRPYFSRSPPEIQIQSVLTAHWVSRSGDIVRLAHELRADALVVNHLAKIGDAMTNAEALGITAIEHFDACMDLLAAMSRYPEIKVTAPIRLKVLQYYRESSGDRSAPLAPNQCPAIDENSQINYDGSISPCQLAQSYGLYDEGHMPSILDDVGTAWNSPVFNSFKRQVKSDIPAVYEHQIPCNRCHFLGRGCRPCPLPDNPDLYKTNYQCLIAEALLEEGHKKGQAGSLTDDERSRIMEDAVRSNPPRHRPRGDVLFPEYRQPSD
jgi:MoaA/NifB/PqqE/SkfB family radical SAM enzyme